VVAEVSSAGAPDAAAEAQPGRMLAAALSYATRGFYVFPCFEIDAAGDCTCAPTHPSRNAKGQCESPGKHPRTAHGFKDAARDPATITAWWTRWPNANVALDCGRSGLLVVDVDPRNQGDATLAELEHTHGPLPDTVRQLTPGGGFHSVLQRPDWPHVRPPKTPLGPGIDIKCDGGYIIATPSTHVRNRHYCFEIGFGFDDYPLAPAPGWLLARLEQRTKARRAAPSRAITESFLGAAFAAADWLGRPLGTDRAAVVCPWEDEHTGGARFDSSTVLFAPTTPPRPVGWFHCSHGHCTGRTLAAVLAALPVAAKATARTQLGFDPELVEEVPPPTDADAPPPDAGAGGAVDISTADDEAVRRTDVGNAQRLVAAFGHAMRYCAPWKRWLVWDGGRWARDDRQRVREYAKTVTRDMLHEAADLPAGDRQRALVEYALRSQKADRLRAMIELAQSDPTLAMVPGDFDADPWLLNVDNGTIDLRSGQLREHRRADLITKLAPVTYDPAATSDVWTRFLADAMQENAALIAFLQRCVGYSLTGTTGEEVLFFLLGPEASGKSTFAEAIKATFGDYARTTDFETFLQKKGDRGIPNDIAALAGARLVVSIEMADGKHLAEGLVKHLTGGDTVSARFLFGEFFDFIPQFKLWLAANDAPRVRHSDRAIWRRILRIPFEHTVPEAARDPAIKATLKDPARGGPAILAWAVAGCLAWQRDRLQVPIEVQTATASYRADQDPLRDFFADCCVFDPSAWTSSKELFAAYRAWGEANGIEKPMTSTAFGSQLAAHGCSPGKAKETRGWHGIALSPGQNPDTGQVRTPDSGKVFHDARTKETYPETGVRTCPVSGRCPRCGSPEWTPPVDGGPGRCATCGAVPVHEEDRR
jgi:putative DNA primase/helicase